MTNERPTSAPLRRLATVLGVVFLIAAGVFIYRGVQRGVPPRAASSTAVRATARPQRPRSTAPLARTTARPPRASETRSAGTEASPALAAARTRVAAGDRARAAARARKALDAGRAALAKNDPRKAVVCFGAALSYLPDDATKHDFASAYAGRARAFAAQRQYRRALSDYDRALHFAPHDLELVRGREKVQQLLTAPHLPAHRPRSAAAPRRTTAPRRTAAPPRAVAVDEECERASRYEQAAANDNAGTLAVYNATVSGLAANASCADETLRVVNEAYLLSLRAPAEAQLHIGDWKADLNRADEYLRRCIALPALRGTKAAADCRTQLSINRTMRARLSALGFPAAR